MADLRYVSVDQLTIEDLQDTLDAYGRRELDLDMHRVAELLAELSRRIMPGPARDVVEGLADVVTATTELIELPVGPRFVKLDRGALGDHRFVNVDDIVELEPFADGRPGTFVWLRDVGRPIIAFELAADIEARIAGTVTT